MHIIFILISLISGVVCGTTFSTKADLLDVIRQDLRRNNDDYVESTISQTLASSEPPKTSITTQVLPVGTKTMKTIKNINSPNLFKTNNLKAAENVKTTKKSSPFRRVFISSEILPIEDKPKHRPIKIDPSQFLMTIRKMPETDSKRQTQFTRASKTNGMIRKNGLDQPDRKTFMQKTKPSTIWKETKAIGSDEELNKIKALMNDIETKDDLQTETTLKPGTQATKMKTQMIKVAQPQRMGLVMNRIHDPPMVTPLREKAPITMDTPSIEELQAPWEVPRLETTRGVINRVGLKRRDSSETPLWRAIESKETSKAINKFQVATNTNKKKEENKTQLNKTKVEAKNVVRTKTKLRQKDNYDLDRINELKAKLREGLKVSSLPPGDLLDLWPARGPMVHALRLKNRLCQRSVLLNEGPKYDSKGGTYQPRFKPRLFGTKKVIDFPQTRSPLLVLPRCCNCCRKSVLGCE